MLPRLLFAVWILSATAAVHADAGLSQFVGEVVRVTDGDTVIVLRQTAAGPREVKVRLTEIDAPESGQPWGARARQALADMVYRQTVQVASSGEDRYGRVLGRLHIAERDVNREMVRGGHAWVYRRYATQNWLPDEDHARAASLGLWSLGVEAAVPPWDWRSGERSRRATVEQHPGMAAVGSVSAASAASLACGSKRLCIEMRSCAEARFYLVQCGLSRLDGNGDGIPCEALCRTPH